MSNDNKKITPVVLCGGSGSRLWPLSRQSFPKQFLQLGDQESLFQKTLNRLAKNTIYNPPVILTNADYRFHAAEQARQIGAKLGGILLEPTPRNTAPAIGVAAFFVAQSSDDTLMHVLPSDHLIDDDVAYRTSIETAADIAIGGHLVTFGITPTSPATGYGYIKAGHKLENNAFVVEKFIEKPAEEQAIAMIEEGGHSWNSGMFLFSADIFIQELRTYESTIADYAKEAVAKATTDLDFNRLHAESFEKCKSISIDYAVFEHTDKAAVVPTTMTWSDIGSWNSLWETQEKDRAGNAVNAQTTLIESENNMVVSDGQHIALNGVSNLSVIATADAVLISDMSKSQQIKTIVEKLQKNPDTAVLAKEHKTNYRPWGGYTSILNGDRFSVKRLFVSPGKRLSLQKHQHRAEHWVVVSGTAEVTLDDRVLTLSENQSVYIPLGSVHRLTNPGKILLEVIEVQSGTYLGEDDIIRLDDDFGRQPNEQ